ncbi:MAG: Two-component system, NarL family, sensor histidine kinase BarA, partial [Parcubacteria group bacterium]|nr:Two-component system, NarL family, sensor histidine kinase BarA [Parcubacteria group bacterium]
MTSAVASAITACAWYPSQYLVLSQNVYAHLIYYSHFGAIIPSVLIALFIVMNNRKGLPGILLALSTLFFSLWVFGDLVIWATDKPEITMFFWTLINIAEPLVYFFLFYFFQTFIFKKDFTLLQKILFIIPVLPTIILAPTHFMLL